jgi:RND family efflux transporter MFP subunit
MTTRERWLLVLGVVAGLAIAGGAFWMLADKPASHATLSVQPVAQAPVDHSTHANPPAADTAMELSTQEQQAIGLKTYTVSTKALAEELRTAGRVEPAETQLSTISARVAGRIDKLFVGFTGQPVRRGQAVASIYSPQVVASAEEYKLALQARKNLGAEAHPQAISQAEALIQASRRRLELWGLTSAQMDEIAQGDSPRIHLNIYSSVQGVITERKVSEGQYVQEGEVLYTVSDLSTIWVLADVYEADLARVRIGQAAQVETDVLRGTPLRGTVSFIDPSVNPQTRTAAVRIQMPNRGLQLRPGMFVNVKLASSQTTELVIPRSAVLETGETRVVYVAKAGGTFERRQVDLGLSSGELVAVRRGLKAGEEVVTDGAFLIDSQTRVSGGMGGMFGGSKEYAKDDAKAGKAEASAKYTVSLSLSPDPPRGGDPVKVRVAVQDETGSPVSDANVTITFLMPAMPSMGMAEMRNSHALKWDGAQYSGEVEVQSSGSWNVTVDVTRAGQRVARHRTQITAR